MIPSVASAWSPYDPTIDWAEHIFGPANMNGFVGCGGLSAGISGQGELTVLNYPFPSFCDQMGYLTLSRTLPRMGAQANMGSFFGLLWHERETKVVSWLRDRPWQHEQHYRSDSSDILITRHINEQLGITVEIYDVVLPDRDILVRHVRMVRNSGTNGVPENLQLLLFENLDPCTTKIPYVPIQDWLLDVLNDFALVYSAKRDALIHFRPDDATISWKQLLPLLGASLEKVDQFVETLDITFPSGVYIAIGADRPCTSFQCGRQDIPCPIGRWAQDAFEDAMDGVLSRNPFAPGRASGALVWDLDLSSGEDAVTIFFSVAPHASYALEALDDVRSRDYLLFEHASDEWWKEKLERAQLPASPDPMVLRVCKRALISIISCCDRRSGAIVASIAPQPPYAQDWPRDGAFLNWALDRAGLTEFVTKRNQWLAQQYHLDTGLVDMCYYADGVPAGPLPFEIDNLSLGIWSLWAHAQFLSTTDERLAYLNEVYPAIRAGADFLVRCRDPSTGLQCPTMEGDQPWLSQGIAGAGSARMALEASWRAGETVGEDRSKILAWKARSEELKHALISAFWIPEKNMFEGGLITCYLFWPFPLLDLDDYRMKAQARVLIDMIMRTLHKETAGGGYEPLALWMLSEQVDHLGTQVKDQIEEALTILSHEVCTPGTLHYGEAFITVDLDGDGTKEFEPHAAQPQVPIAAMMFSTAMALYGSDISGRDGMRSSAVDNGCGGCSVAEHPGNFSAEIIFFLVMLVVCWWWHASSVRGPLKKKDQSRLVSRKLN